jgi:hypothetical protein
MMTPEKEKIYKAASERAGEIARADRSREWKELKEEILTVFGEDLKKSWLNDIENLETHEERIRYVLERKNLMAKVFFPEDYEKLGG